MIKSSGLRLRKEAQDFDARVKFSIPKMEGRTSPVCRCGDVLQGKCLQQIVKYLERMHTRFIRSGHVWCQNEAYVPHITSIIVEENKYIRCEMTPTSVGGRQQECRGILEKERGKTMDNQKGKTVSLAHGAGGKQTSELIDQVFKAHFANPELTSDDAAVLKMKEGKIAFTTDGFIVSPSEFPGGNIGKLSICGTVNDLSCMGAKPLYLSCAFVIEEGFPMEKLEAIAAAMEKTAKEAGVKIVAGDTKVAGKGQVDGVFITTTTGIGEIQEGVETSGFMAKPGDAVIVSGDIGRHGCTILLAREDFGIDADVTSDCAPLWGTVQDIFISDKGGTCNS